MAPVVTLHKINLANCRAWVLLTFCWCHLWNGLFAVLKLKPWWWADRFLHKPLIDGVKPSQLWHRVSRFCCILIQMIENGCHSGICFCLQGSILNWFLQLGCKMRDFKKLYAIVTSPIQPVKVCVVDHRWLMMFLHQIMSAFPFIKVHFKRDLAQHASSFSP